MWLGIHMRYNDWDICRFGGLPHKLKRTWSGSLDGLRCGHDYLTGPYCVGPFSQRRSHTLSSLPIATQSKRHCFVGIESLYIGNASQLMQ